MFSSRPQNTRTFTTGNYSWTSGAANSWAHGLLRVNYARVQAICINADNGWSAGDIVELNPMVGGTSGGGVVIGFPSGGTTLHVETSASGPLIRHKTTGAAATITNANWRLNVTLYGN